VLDIRHVVGYRWAAANALFGEASQAGQHGVQHKLTEMLSGRVGYVIGGLRPILTKQPLRKSVRQTRAKVITFLHNHRRWMPYDQYLAMGLPVGTGVVESACGSVVKPRMEGEGQRWSLAGAEAMLALRSLKKSHDHDLRDDWRFHARQVRLGLDGRQATYRPTERLKRAASLDSKRLRSNGLGSRWALGSFVAVGTALPPCQSQRDRATSSMRTTAATRENARSDGIISPSTQVV
jgi:hypothetical protein